MVVCSIITEEDKVSEHDISRKLHLVFGQKTIHSSVICDIIRKYPNIDVSIQKADMANAIGYVEITLTAPEEETIKAVINYLFSQGVEVKHLDLVKVPDFQQAA